MGFLDNSGDIILDAVLTDAGRKELAAGTFSITKFALGDDEINYQLYNPAHPSGSSYYDLEIVQTPVLESFTNNSSTMKSRLISIGDNNLLYLPVLKENTSVTAAGRYSDPDIYLVAVDDKTQRTNNFDSGDSTIAGGIGRNASGVVYGGVLFGKNPADADNHIIVDQGIDNQNKPKTDPLASDLKEEQYIIQIDGKFGSIVNTNGDEPPDALSKSKDDDGFLFYTIDSTSTNMMENLDSTSNSPIAGSRGTRIKFKIMASENLKDNFAYFDRYGFVTSITTTEGSIAAKAIDTTVRVTGVNLGYSVDLPIRFIKATAEIA